MQILGPRLINNDKYLLYIEDAAMDPSRKRKQSSSAPPVASRVTTNHTVLLGDDGASIVEGSDPRSSRKSKRRRKEKVVERFLGEDYKPSPNDCICGRGKEAASHPGNVKFRHLIDSNLQTYRETQSKKEKTTIVCNIIESVRSGIPKGKFVRKHDDGRWYETGDDFAREKIGQCFRDRLHTEYRSSSKAKISRRKENITDESTRPMDFDEYVASPDNPSQNPSHLVKPSVGLQQSARHTPTQRHPGWTGEQTTNSMLPEAEREFAGPVRRKTNFQGLADMYFGDSSYATTMNQQYSASTRPERQQHIDLLGSLTHNSRDSSRTFHTFMNTCPNNNSTMDQSFRGNEMSHPSFLENGNILPFGNHQEMRFSCNTTNNFASCSTNAFAGDRSAAFGMADNVAIRESLMDQSQRVSGFPSLSMEYRRLGEMGVDMAAMGAVKGLGYMQHGSGWLSKAERKPPPMPPSMFEAPLLPNVPIQGNVLHEEHAPLAEGNKASPEGVGSSGDSSMIPDDEPLPLDQI
ncbi:hypothetical protein IV203_030035 [Nitzschia inconspicua]|uniref:DUF6824 domain-containing protein n=1 Tax=Nitzschia inconspicua TaxID=303405 RepID=A0A9K3Q3W9_9STRA|nr:hypothetical protein IV203_030035 [Nitzschia inconspicua]